MPIVYAYLPDGKNGVSHHALKRFCDQMIPAALNSPQGPLCPGSVIFIPTFADMPAGSYATIVVEAQRYDDRAAKIDEIAANIASYLKLFLRGANFNLQVKLVDAGWVFASKAPPFKGDMSLEAAWDRLVNGPV